MMIRLGSNARVIDLFSRTRAFGTTDFVSNTIRLTIGSFTAFANRMMEGANQVTNITNQKGATLARVIAKEWPGLGGGPIKWLLAKLFNWETGGLFKGLFTTLTATDKDGKALANGINIRVFGERILWFNTAGQRVSRATIPWGFVREGRYEWFFEIADQPPVDPAVFILFAATRLFSHVKLI